MPENNSPNNMLDLNSFQNQLKLLNVSNEFKNTCKFLISEMERQGNTLQNFMLATCCLIDDLDDKNFDMTDEKLKPILDKKNILMKNLENGINFKVVDIKPDILLTL